MGGGALKRGHGAPFERFAQFGDALGGVGTLDFTISILVVAAERVAGQAVSMTKEECQRALTQKQTLWGGGAPQVGDLRLLEDGRERRDALVSDAVVSETASEGWGGDGERVDVSMGSDRKAKARPKAHLSEVTELPLSPSHSLVMPSVVYSP